MPIQLVRKIILQRLRVFFKKIQLHTKDETVFQNFIENVIDLRFEQTRDYYSIEYGYHHWHYRTDESLDKSKFQELLIDEGFEYIKMNK